MRIRFIVPFAIFITLFFISSALAYYFYSTKISIQNEITEIGKKIDTQGSIVFLKAQSCEGLLKSITKRVGFTDTLGVTLESPNNYIGSLKDINTWYQNQIKKLKRVNQLKSQHPTEFSQYIAMDPKDQLDSITNIISSIEGELGNAVNEARQFAANTQNVLDDNRRMELQAIGNSLSGIYSEAGNLITSIKSEVSKFRNLVESPKEELLFTDVLEARQAMYNAQNNGLELLDKLTYIKSNIGGEEKFIIIPKLADSSARNLTAELLLLLHPNESSYFMRDYTGDISNSTIEPADTYKVADLEFIALVADALSEENATFNTNPLYIAGINLENIIDSQELTIESLIQLNHMLKAKVETLYNTRNPIDPVETYNRNRADIDSVKRDNTERVEEAAGNVLNLKTTDETSKNQFISLKSNFEGDFVSDEELWWQQKTRPYQDLIAAHRERRKNLEDYFINLKKQLSNGLASSEGKYRVSTDSDGRIAFVDRKNKLYNIELGRADNIRPGMRFMVYNMVGGVKIVKGMIEVLRIPSDHFSVCGEVYSYDDKDKEIIIGDSLYNPLYRNGRFVKTALVGIFEPPDSPITEEMLTQYLNELGVPVLEKADGRAEVIILAKPADKIREQDASRRPREKNYLEYRAHVNPDEILASDLLVFFQDQ